MKAIVIFLFFTNILYSYTMELNIEPSDVNLTINSNDYSKDIKNNNFKKDFSNGEYNIKICKSNYQCYNKKIWIMDNDLKLSVKLIANKSTLVIVSSNINSKIYVNDKKIEKGEIINFKKSQTINIKEEKDFFVTNNMKFKINLGETYHLNLPKMPDIKKTLTIKGRHPKASIRLNGKEICKAACNYSLKAGKYNISIIEDKYFPYEEEIEIKDEDLIVNYKLNKIPDEMKFGLGLSYNYGRLIGGYPQLNTELKLKNKINFKLDLIYVVNFSSNSEYYGIVIGSSYDIFKYNNILNVYMGVDFIFSKYIDDNINYLQNGIGVNLGGSVQIINDFYFSFDITNRLHYMYNDKFYDILGKVGLIYYF